MENNRLTDKAPRITAAIENAADNWKAKGNTYTELNHAIQDGENGLIKADKAIKHFISKLTK
jgi:hypothetical protein